MDLIYGNAVVIDGAEVSLTEQIDGGEVSLTRTIDGGEVGDSFVPLPHITIGEVETLPPDAEATATMTGTASQPVLNLGLVRGQKGDKGDKGDAGSLASVTATIDANTGTPSIDVVYDGDNAEFNFHNLKGAKGDKGDKGDTGEQGIQGERGIQGVKGDTGETGNGIESAELNSDYTLTLDFTDGTSYTTPSIRGMQGEQGIQGVKGDTGAAAGFGNVTATVDANVGTPSVTVTPSGTDTAKNFAFAFHNLKGVQGEKGVKGDTGAAAGFGAVTASVDSGVGTPSVVVTTGGTDEAKTFNFAFHNLKGADGSGAVISVNGKDGNVTLDAEDVGALPDDTVIPSKTSDLQNDSGFISTETDPTVPSWAKASSKPSYTASEVGAVPTSRTVNGKALSSNITLTASDVSALPSSTSIPSKTSDLTNDSGFLTLATLPIWDGSVT